MGLDTDRTDENKYSEFEIYKDKISEVMNKSKFAYIPDSEYREKFNPNDYGIEYKEIILIKEIMEYLESHKEEINDLCVGYDWEDRKIINEESENK